MKSKTLTLTAVITLLLAAMAGPCWLAAQEQEQQRLKTRQQYSVTDMGTAIALSAQNEQEDSNRAVKFTNLIDFDLTNGQAPGGSLVQGTDGNLYGTTYGGGSGGFFAGTVFKITSGGTLTTLYNFCSQASCADGSLPGPLLLSTDGNFYGITVFGGANGSGTVFKITPSGTLTTLYNFCSQPSCADGSYVFFPEPNTLVQATDGNFYGTNDGGGGPASAGTFFRLTPSGVLTTLHTFCSQSGCSDGGSPFGLTQATDGNFYGTTGIGGANFSAGTVFKITPSGTLTTLYNFCSQPNCTDGALPFAPLIQAIDGNFYGTTSYGGANVNSASCAAEASFCGTVFKITANGTLTTLYNFCSQTNCADGANPNFRLVQATDANFYGSAFLGGNSTCIFPFSLGYGCGTVYKLTAGGALRTLHSFDETDGVEPLGLFQATNGTIYGATLFGGPNNSSCLAGSCGTLFRLSVGLGPFVETLPSAGTEGEAVTILGTDLSDATHVFFDHTEAAFTVVSETEIQTTVPAGATTGLVTVTRHGPLLRSNVKFQVLP